MSDNIQFFASKHGKFPCIQYNDALYFKRTSKMSCPDRQTQHFLKVTHTYKCCCIGCKARILVKVLKPPGEQVFPSLIDADTRFEVDDGDENIIHTCTALARREQIQRRAFRQQLYRRIQCVEVSSSRSEPRKVFKALRREFAGVTDNNIATVVPPWRSIRQSARRIVLSNIARSPATMEELIRLDCIPNEISFTIGSERQLFVLSCFVYIEEDGNTSAMIFLGTELNLRELLTAKHVMSDATYKVCPYPFRIGVSGQLLTLCTFFGNSDDSRQLYPRVYVLMERKTRLAYNKLLNHIIDLGEARLNLPAHRVQWTSWSLDYEMQFWVVLRDLARLPNKIVIFGCYFHFCQAVIGHIRELGLIELYRDSNSGLQVFVSRLLALAFLAPNKVRQAFETLIEAWIPLNIKSNVEFLKFVTYFENQWIKNPKLTVSDWNIYGVHCSVRTTNALERMHRLFKEELGERANLFEFIVRLRRLQLDFEIDERQHRQTGIGPNIRSRRTRENADRLRRIQARYAEQPDRDEIQVIMYYLSKVSYFVLHEPGRYKRTIEAVDDDE